MNTQQVAENVVNKIISDLIYAYDIDKVLAERIVNTILLNPKLAVELEEKVKSKKVRLSKSLDVYLV